MSRLAIYLLGPPRIELDGKELHIPRRKALALLAYLAVEPGRHNRDVLATLFWPEYDQSGARGRLRRTLSSLNRALGEGWLAVDRELARLNADADPSAGLAEHPEFGERTRRALWLDVDQFRRRLAACQPHGHAPGETCPDCLARLSKAVELYRDDFMAGFTLPDSLAFDKLQFRLFVVNRHLLAAQCEQCKSGGQ